MADSALAADGRAADCNRVADGRRRFDEPAQGPEGLWCMLHWFGTCGCQQTTHGVAQVIQLTPAGVTVVRDAAWDAARRTFADRHFVVLPRFVENSLLDRLVRQIAKASFCERERPLGGREQTMAEPRRVPWLFWQWLNHRDVFAAMQELADTCNDTFGPAVTVTGKSAVSRPVVCSRWCRALLPVGTTIVGTES